MSKCPKCLTNLSLNIFSKSPRSKAHKNIILYFVRFKDWKNTFCPFQRLEIHIKSSFPFFFKQRFHEMTAAHGIPAEWPTEKGEEPEAAEGSLVQVETLRFRTVVLVGKEITHKIFQEKKHFLKWWDFSIGSCSIGGFVFWIWIVMATRWIKRLPNSMQWKTHLWNAATGLFHEMFIDFHEEVVSSFCFCLIRFSKDAQGSEGYSEDYEDEDQGDQTSCDASNDDAITSCWWRGDHGGSCSLIYDDLIASRKKARWERSAGQLHRLQNFVWSRGSR